MDGILNIYKEKGFTSHDVVAKLRGILKMKKIGHTGTLDPEAEGVLPVCLGTATRLCNMLTDKIKEYRVVMRFGVATDTEDMTGEIIEELPVTATEEDLKTVLSKFLGEQEQIPPMYSAIKVEGKKLYELAREGKVIERKGRPIVIHNIVLHSVETDKDGFLYTAELTVTCGKGTYIRSLCRDIGKALGTCACMKSLLRTRSGDSYLENSFKLSEVEALRDAGTLEKHIVTVEQVFKTCKAFQMKPEWDKLLLNGNHMNEQDCVVYENGLSTCVENQKEKSDQLVATEFPINWYRAYDSTGKFLGLYKKEGKKFTPVKMFL
ncbi:MAG: tRNA pseudouridine(55) synthase TruB [Lachnospiraceae bacterium]|nr:tRNA pseudouridine(55) synthase TruB [Lachnospiraceae bacterium]